MFFTIIHTYRQDQNYIPHRFTGGQKLHTTNNVCLKSNKQAAYYT